jgi:hypothetical protein
LKLIFALARFAVNKFRRKDVGSLNMLWARTFILG